MERDKNLQSEIVKCADIVRKKVQMLNDQKIGLENFTTEFFRPITEKLENKSLKAETQSETEEKSNINSIPDEETQLYNEDIEDNTLTEEIPSPSPTCFSTPKTTKNVPYGIRIENGTKFIGNTKFEFSKDKNEIIIGKFHYFLTPGLETLIFDTKPNLKKVDSSDKNVYKQILQLTSAHKNRFSPKAHISANGSYKYRSVIKPLFKPGLKVVKTLKSKTETEPKKLELKKEVKGKGLPSKKMLNPLTDLIYWNDPNELVERLKLLLSSREAGNTGNDNEIISIIEELKEDGYIQ